MPTLRGWFPRIRRPRVWVAVLIAAVLFVSAIPHLTALYSWHAAEKALARHRAREAASHLDRCLRIWPRFAAAHLSAARAARLLEDYDGAEQQLLECQRLEGRSSEASLFEWALLKAENGDIKS